ncbi:MAG: hypothetical protein JWN06_463 [Propionibacteriaceae bacterium]|jgi:hypothetical protein|nr:hypothetical protein [Propionibacteriaceae bacterium]
MSDNHKSPGSEDGWATIDPADAARPAAEKVFVDIGPQA